VGIIDLMDSSGKIRGFFFNDLSDRLMTTLAVNKVYKVKGGRIKKVNSQNEIALGNNFNICNSDFEIIFGPDTVFENVNDEDAPKVSYNFVKIGLIEHVEPGCLIDILAIVQVCLAEPKSQVSLDSFQDSFLIP
jgi:hypothetical protein